LIGLLINRVEEAGDAIIGQALAIVDQRGGRALDGGQRRAAMLNGTAMMTVSCLPLACLPERNGESLGWLWSWLVIIYHRSG